MVALGGNQVEMQPVTGGPTEMKLIEHVKYILPADRYIDHCLIAPCSEEGWHSG